MPENPRARDVTRSFIPAQGVESRNIAFTMLTSNVILKNYSILSDVFLVVL